MTETEEQMWDRRALRTRIADLLAEHWFGPGGCVCRKQNGVEWTYHAADLILEEVNR